MALPLHALEEQLIALHVLPDDEEGGVNPPLGQPVQQRGGGGGPGAVVEGEGHIGPRGQLHLPQHRLGPGRRAQLRRRQRQRRQRQQSRRQPLLPLGQAPRRLSYVTVVSMRRAGFFMRRIFGNTENRRKRLCLLRALP